MVDSIRGDVKARAGSRQPWTTKSGQGEGRKTKRTGDVQEKQKKGEEEEEEDITWNSGVDVDVDVAGVVMRFGKKRRRCFRPLRVDRQRKASGMTRKGKEEAEKKKKKSRKGREDGGFHAARVPGQRPKRWVWLKYFLASDQRALEMAIEGESAETPGSLGGGVGTEGRARRELLPVLAFAFALSPQARVVCSTAEAVWQSSRAKQKPRDEQRSLNVFIH
ncbi:hypothetical protein HL42_8166 [Trichophyton rubrum]|nr:hypothetical protein HL42_8166 [Trichophyton rubrum]